LQKSINSGNFKNIRLVIVTMSLLKKFIFSSSLLILLTSLTTSALPLQAVVTHNIFYTHDENGWHPYVEMYWQINPNSMLFDKKEGLWVGNIQTDITITKQHQTVVEEHYLLATKPQQDVNNLLNQRITDLKRFYLTDTGTYQLTITLTDYIQKKEGYQYSKIFTIAPLNGSRFSDIQLVDTLLPSQDVKNDFYRNGNLQIPLCANFYDDQRKTLRFYNEYYEPNGDLKMGTIKSYISKKENAEALYNLIHSQVLQKHSINIIQNHFDISVLPSGNYFLNIALFDSTGNYQQKHKSLFFQVMNSAPIAFKAPIDTNKKATDTTTKQQNNPTYLNLNKTYLSKYTPEQIRMILKMLNPIADPVERNNINDFLKRPDDMYARYFIYNFWLKRSKIQPEDAWMNYAEQVKKVNKLFGTSMIRGFESERGRVYLQYGEPSERIKVENEDGALPYEIWQYNTVNTQSNALFLFYRPGFLGSDYLLLHSTYLGEKAMKNWRRELYLLGKPRVNDSKADISFGNR